MISDVCPGHELGKKGLLVGFPTKGAEARRVQGVYLGGDARKPRKWASETGKAETQ